jgi:hypothetical protein
VSELWAEIDQNSLDAVQTWLRQKALWAWDPYGRTFFDLPTWIVLAALSVLLVLLGRKKRKLIGYARD